MDDDAQERADELTEATSLKRREAEVQALKERGLSHGEIAEELELARSTVDEYSRRINDRIERAEATLREIESARGVAPDRREVVDISAIEECQECGNAPASIILTGDGWECYGCGAPLEAADGGQELVTDGGVSREAADSDELRDLSTLAEAWQEKGRENVDEWGVQELETLLLVAQEELGELTQAVLEYRNEGGDAGDVLAELDDLSALMFQIEWSVLDEEIVDDERES